jgi:hypothetical protein
MRPEPPGILQVKSYDAGGRPGGLCKGGWHGNRLLVAFGAAASPRLARPTGNGAGSISVADIRAATAEDIVPGTRPAARRFELEDLSKGKHR